MKFCTTHARISRIHVIAEAGGAGAAGAGEGIIICIPAGEGIIICFRTKNSCYVSSSSSFPALFHALRATHNRSNNDCYPCVRMPTPNGFCKNVWISFLFYSLAWL